MEAEQVMSGGGKPLYQALEEHLEQAPLILREQARQTQPLDLDADCLVASGSGDSLAAAHVLASSQDKAIAIAIDPADALYMPWLNRWAARCTLIALSVGGRTRTLIELARHHQSRGGRVITVTAEPSSPLAQLADRVVPLVTGAPSGGVGGVRHLAMLVALARAFAGENPTKMALNESPPGACPGFTEPWTYVGAGDSRSTAFFASLKANEAFGTPNPSTSVEELLHAQAFALPNRYLLLHPTRPSPVLARRLETAAEVLGEMGTLLEWRPLGSVFATAIYHSLHLLQCLAREARERGVDTVAYKKHPLLPQLTNAIYGEGL